MNIVNFLEQDFQLESVHGGQGQCQNCRVMGPECFDTPIRFVYYTILPPDASFGEHTHGNDNEVYIVLEGEGRYVMNGEEAPVKAGDILVNRPFATHALFNTGSGPMRVLVFEAYNP